MTAVSTRTGTLTVAVVGNPNSGKTTIFNGLTGTHQRVGNWPGVTVEKKEGTLHASDPERNPIRIIDLPGIYSLNATSEDEIVARDFILSREYDLVVSIVDAANLERNLYLTLQLIEMNVPLLVVLNKMDRAKANGITIDAAHLATHLGCPVIPATAVISQGISDIREAVDSVILSPQAATARIRYPDRLEETLENWTRLLETAKSVLALPLRYAALRLLEGDEWIESIVDTVGVLPVPERASMKADLEDHLGDELDIVIADARYGFIHGVSRDVSRKKLSRATFTDKLDNVVMNRWLGVPIFLGAMYLVFWATIAVGGAFIDFFDIAFGTVFVDGFGVLLESIGSPEWLVRVLADGVGAGIQTVATFVPILFMMFFMLSLLEDSGYMARAAFVMDRVMRWVGLPGKSFVPMLVGFGCTVPAVTGTRTLETKKDRFMTIFMAPFMSCGARLPVYALFAAALFAGNSGLVVFSLYAIGIVLAILTGLLLKFTLFGGEYSHFVMELPAYHAPRLKMIATSAWLKLRVFIVRAGITITVVVTVLALLNSFGTDGTFGNEDSENSVLSAIGKSITPVFRPMGIEEDNWPATVGLFTGLFAKEAVVGTLSSLYSMEDAAEAAEDEAGSATPDEAFSLTAGLGEAIATIPENLAGVFGALTDPLGVGIISDDQAAVGEELEVEDTLFVRMRNQFTSASAYAYLLFILIYFPCVAALGAAVREMGHGYGWLLAGYLTALAWALATLVYQFASGPALGPVLLAMGILGGIVVTFIALKPRARSAVAH